MIDITHSSDTEREGIISDLLPDLTPLLDVMFMLIIFLVLTTNSAPHVFDVILPEDNQKVAQAEEDPNAISVTLSATANNWLLDEKSFSNFETFSTALLKHHRQHPQNHIMIYGDKSVTMEKLLELLTFMRANDIPTADIVMKQK